MKNKLFYILFLIAVLSSCSKGKPDHPLIVPPEFKVLPQENEENKELDRDIESDDDIRELKDLLLD